MTIYQRMEMVFAEAGVPGFLQGWRATEAYPVIPDTYCAYIVSGEGAALCADDVELMHRVDVQLHIFGKRDVSGAVSRVCKALGDGDFLISRLASLDDARESEYIYHRQINAAHIMDLEG